MKRLLTLLAASALALLVANAETFPPMLRADIPFDFHMGDKTMKAGSYDLTIVRLSTVPLAIMSRRSAKPVNALAPGYPRFPVVGGDDKSRLVFYKYDNDHSFLREIVIFGGATGFDLPLCRTEREHVTSTITLPVVMRQPEKVTILAGAR